MATKNITAESKLNESDSRLTAEPCVIKQAEKTEEKGGESLEDLCASLKQSIASNDWLKENTADKWIKENPELAQQYMEAAKKS